MLSSSVAQPGFISPPRSPRKIKGKPALSGQRLLQRRGLFHRERACAVLVGSEREGRGCRAGNVPGWAGEVPRPQK